MPQTAPRLRAYACWTAGLLLTSALCACNGRAADPTDGASANAEASPAPLPMSTTTPAAFVAAPPVTAMIGTSGARVVATRDRREGYGYLVRATNQERALADAPPDYSFDEGGVRPWTWSTGDGARVISEPVAGGYRTYYYTAGSDTPYLVRDPRYAYAYDSGALVAVYLPDGAPVDINADPSQALYAGRYQTRGAGLWRHADHGQHLPVNAYAWADRRGDLVAQRAAWHHDIGANTDMAAWRSTHHDEDQAPIEQERARHEAAAAQFGTWQQQHFQGPPPAMYGAGGHTDHTAAIVGGAVAAGIAASVGQAVFGHHDAPHRTMGPAMVPQSDQHSAAPDRRGPHGER